jgi:pimeloyl-ACP methyl ester carboxylesterase
MSATPTLICLSAVPPVEWTYAGLERALNGDTTVVLKELEGYAEPFPSPYRVHDEIQGIATAAGSRGVERFHLLGFSISASIALVAALSMAERIESLTLVEPVWIGGLDGDAAEAECMTRLDRVMALPPLDRWAALRDAVSAPGTDLSIPAGNRAPEWTRHRPARFPAIWQALRTERIEEENLRAFRPKVYLPVGGQSHPWFRRAAQTLHALFPSATMEIYEKCTHLDPPHRREPERFARALAQLWRPPALARTLMDPRSASRRTVG